MNMNYSTPKNDPHVDAAIVALAFALAKAAAAVWFGHQCNATPSVKAFNSYGLTTLANAAGPVLAALGCENTGWTSALANAAVSEEFGDDPARESDPLYNDHIQNAAHAMLQQWGVMTKVAV